MRNRNFRVSIQMPDGTLSKLYTGKLTTCPDYLDTSDVLCISHGDTWDMDDETVADEIARDIDVHGKYLSVEYTFSPTPIVSVPLQTQHIEGTGYARYETFTDEYTDENGEIRYDFDGYVEVIEIAGCDFLATLKEHLGAYVYLVIEYSDEKRVKSEQ